MTDRVCCGSEPENNVKGSEMVATDSSTFGMMSVMEFKTSDETSILELPWYDINICDYITKQKEARKKTVQEMYQVMPKRRKKYTLSYVNYIV